MNDRDTTPRTRTLLAAITAIAAAIVVLVTYAVWRTEASLWAKLAGSFVVVLAVTGFAVRMWLVSHPYGALPRRRRR